MRSGTAFDLSDARFQEAVPFETLAALREQALVVRSFVPRSIAAIEADVR